MIKHKRIGYADNNPHMMPKRERDATIAAIMADVPGDVEADRILTESVLRQEKSKRSAS